MKTNIFMIRCISNMRVGNGDANYSLIDNQFERDTVMNNVPVINASGIKGALREHFVAEYGKDSDKIKDIFGSENSQGRYKFLQATTLFRPLRVSEGNRTYIESSSPELINYFNSTVQSFCPNIKKLSENEGLYGDSSIKAVEGKKRQSKDVDSETEALLKKVFGSDEKIGYYVTSELSNYDFPVIARNVLDNGTSKNLWFEEVVPHETILWFAILSPDEMDEDFKHHLEKDLFQFGGSASVGYGICKIIAL